MWHDYDSEKEIQKVGDFSIKQTSDTVIFWEKKKTRRKIRRINFHKRNEIRLRAVPCLPLFQRERERPRERGFTSNI